MSIFFRRKNPEETKQPDPSLEELFPKRVLILGQSGSGKSSIINVLHNHDCSWRESLTEPAITGDSAKGITGDIDFYYVRKMLLTDTIGLSDSRFEHTDIVKDLKKLFKVSEVNFTHFFIVLPKERINRITRASLALLKEMLSFVPQSNLFLVISKCDDGESVQDFTRINAEDVDINYWIDRVARENVATTTFRRSDNAIIDGVLRGFRLASFGRLQEFLSRDVEPVRFPPETFTEFMRRILEVVFPILFPINVPKFGPFVELIKSVSDISVRPKLHYPICPICLQPGYSCEDGMKPNRNEPCHHIYHSGCCCPDTYDTETIVCLVCRSELSSVSVLPVL